jgi:hypothetical protein
MPLTIDLGPEVATFPAFDDPDEVGAVIFAINQSRIKHGLPPHQWDFADLVALGVPRHIAEALSPQELPKLHTENGPISNWDDVRQLVAKMRLCD